MSLLIELLAPFWGYIVGSLGMIGAVFLGRRSGVTAERRRNAEDQIDRAEKGRDAVRDGRASGKSPADRLRENDGKWN